MFRNLLCGAVILAAANEISSAALVNLALNASGSGTLPVATLGQGDTGGGAVAGLYDASMFTWIGGGATSPRTFGTNTIQPYMTWSSDQSVRVLRVWFDSNATNIAPANLDRLVLDTLVSGGSPTTEGDWVTRYDTGTGFANTFLDVDLGQTQVTRGVRVRAFKTTNDVNVGEVAVFGPQPKTGSLTSNRVAPSGTTTASSSRFRAPPQASDQDWINSWLSETTAANPGTVYTLTQPYAAANMTGFSLTFAPQGGFADVPASWQIQVDGGTGFYTVVNGVRSLGSTGINRLQYYYDLPSGLFGVNAVRLLVNESAMPGANGPAVVELEAFNLPEPSMALAGAGLVLTLLRRRHR